MTLSNVELASEHQVHYRASSSLSKSEGEGEGEEEEASMHEVVEVADNAMPPPKPPSNNGQEPPPTITYSYDGTVIPATVTYAAYKYCSPIQEVIFKVIGSEKKSTASQIEFLQSVDFDEEDWLIAMHVTEIINLICKLFSHGAQFHYCLYTQWVTKMQGSSMALFIAWPLI